MAEHVLILLRHAKSDWSGNHVDADRPLAPRGRRQAPEAGAWLAAEIGDVDLAVVSSAARARATWQLVAAALGRLPPTTISESVYAASAADLLEVVRALPEEAGTVVLVGHNPGLEDLVALLTGEDVALPTSAIAVLDLPRRWDTARPGSAELVTSGRPPAA